MIVILSGTFFPWGSGSTLTTENTGTDMEMDEIDVVVVVAGDLRES